MIKVSAVNRVVVTDGESRKLQGSVVLNLQGCERVKLLVMRDGGTEIPQGPNNATNYKDTPGHPEKLIYVKLFLSICWEKNK